MQELKKRVTEGHHDHPAFGPCTASARWLLRYDAEEKAKTCPVCEDVFNNRYALPLLRLTKEQLDLWRTASSNRREMQEAAEPPRTAAAPQRATPGSRAGGRGRACRRRAAASPLLRGEAGV